MFTKIALRLSGIDLRDPEAYNRIPDDLGHLGFEANGGVSSAVFASEDPRPVGAALDAARCIAKRIPGVHVTEIYDELVSTADIAVRCEVGAEAVRLWVNGRRRSAQRPFPATRQVVGYGTKPMSLWAWRDVLAWTREVVGIDADEDVTYLDDTQIAELNAELAGCGAGPANSPWQPLESNTVSVVAMRTETVQVSNPDVTLQRIDEVLYGELVITRSTSRRPAAG